MEQCVDYKYEYKFDIDNNKLKGWFQIKLSVEPVCFEFHERSMTVYFEGAICHIYSDTYQYMMIKYPWFIEQDINMNVKWELEEIG